MVSSSGIVPKKVKYWRRSQKEVDAWLWDSQMLICEQIEEPVLG